MGEVEECVYCGHVDENYDESSGLPHDASSKHMLNKILYNFKNNKSQFTGNRDGMTVVCSAQSSFESLVNLSKGQLRLSAKPNESVKFNFNIANVTRNDAMLVVGMELAHPQNQFQMNQHGFHFGEDPYVLDPKSNVPREVSVTFTNAEIGHFEMPIVFTFQNMASEKIIIIVREMVVFVEETKFVHDKAHSPYTDLPVYAENLYRCRNQFYNSDLYRIPKNLKIIFARGLKIQDNTSDEERELINATKAIFDTGIIDTNYTWFFHHLLWYEETAARINLKKYNMTRVSLQLKDDFFILEVPGLAEKRPSLLRGDRILVKPNCTEDVMFEGIITDIQESNIHISNLDLGIRQYYTAQATFDIRFLMSRVPPEQMHRSVHDYQKHTAKVFPQPAKREPAAAPRISSFFNPSIAGNNEQRSAVEHIVAGTSGSAPYMVYGPPGTGKTITIVESILQLVKKRDTNRIMVCTDSNMAADHIACAILKYKSMMNVPNLLLRANSQSRVWETMPKELEPYSNGDSYETFRLITKLEASTYKIIVATLSHSFKFGMSANKHKKDVITMTHLFIDEAAQATEPASLIPISGLLKPSGSLILAGDPQQLGPVCISKAAGKLGLGISLMERLTNNCKELYTDDANYIMMLKNNFRSHKDIIEIPNELFYDNQLRACAPHDPLSDVDILTGGTRAGRAIIFHGVMSREQKEGKSPSYFNMKEIEMLKTYVIALIKNHSVQPSDIGVVTPYARQAFKIRMWLKTQGYDDMEVGTVEAFQGKEKRVIIITTVRANCKLLDYDAKYQLGFLVDDKRFNVALTRAKSKAIVIGNVACLCRDAKWRKYMDKCKEYGSYFGKESEQLERSTAVLNDVAILRFNRYRLTDELKRLQITNQSKKKKKNKKSTLA